MPDYREKLQRDDFFKVVFVGDIQTTQPYSKPTWTDWLQRTLWDSGDVQTSWRRRVINSAIDRATPKHVTTYFSEYIGQYRPDLVVLSFGVSPMYPTYDEKAFSADLDGLLDTIQRTASNVALWSPYPLHTGENRSTTLALGALYKQKAIERNLQFIDLYHEFDEIELARVMTNITGVKNELFGLEVGKPDFISLNEIGNYIVAKKMSIDLFRLPLTPVSVGSFIVPQLDTIKRWG